jgi:REP element-mobilizing transposase RayT
MPSSYTSLSYHIVFSTKYRERALTDPIRIETYKYIVGIVKNRQSHVIEIGGVEDHIHILTSCSPTLALADFIRDIKANSSKWLHEDKGLKQFQWQTGYGAFTVSYSQIEAVRHYIATQAEHHRGRSFEDEFRTMLRLHHIEFDEQYLFETAFQG